MSTLKEREGQAAEIIKLTNLVNAEVAELETWALGNLADSKRDSLKFWALKVPAILVSASSAFLAYLGSPRLTAIAAGIGSLCVLLDGLIGAGTLRKVHYGAFLDLRMLENELHDGWKNGLLKDTDATELATKLLNKVAKAKQKIAGDLKRAETI